MTSSSGGLLSIGQAALAVGVSERALRYYQQLGLLTPSGATPGGLRRYAPADLDRVRRIRELQELLGFDLEEIRPILADEDRLAALRAEYHDPATSERRRREIAAESFEVRQGLRAAVVAKIDRLQVFLADIDASIDRVRKVLDADAAPVG